MSIAFWLVFSVYILIQGFIAYHFIRSDNKYYLKAILSSNVIFILYVIAELIFDIGVPYLIRILAIAALFIHTVFGYFKDRYTRSKVFDRYMHAFGTFAYSLFIYELLFCLLQPSISPRIYETLFVFVLGIALGTLFEICEFIIDQNTPVKTQRDLKDTDVDLICDVIGSLVAAIVVYLFMR